MRNIKIVTVLGITTLCISSVMAADGIAKSRSNVGISQTETGTSTVELYKQIVNNNTATSLNNPDVVNRVVTATGGKGGNKRILGDSCSNSSVDVDQPSNNTCMANFYQDDLAQSFIPNASSYSGAGIEFTEVSTGDEVTISLWDALPNAGGTMLASGTGARDGTTWLDVEWSPVNVTLGNTYYLVFELASGSQGQCIAGDTTNPYPDGMTYANSGYGEFPDFDYTFRTWSCDDGGGGDCEQYVIDVDQPSNNTCMANFYQDDLAQSFIPTSDNCAGAGIEFTEVSTGDEVTISLWDALPNAGGTMLATGTGARDGTTWLDVEWSPVNITPEDSLYLVFELASGSQGQCIAGDTTNPYPDGMTYANSGYGEFPDFDYTFRTWSCDEEGGNPCHQDLNGDGVVDTSDLLELISVWGPCP